MTEISKSITKASESFKRNDNDVVYAGQITMYQKEMWWLENTSLLQATCRGVWLCKLKYPVMYRLILNKSDMRQTSAILNKIEKQYWISNWQFHHHSYSMNKKQFSLYKKLFHSYKLSSLTKWICFTRLFCFLSFLQ